MAVAIVTKYLGPTNYRGSRIVASVPERIASCDPESRDRAVHRPSHWRLTIPYPHELNPFEAHQRAAMMLAERLGWYGTWYGGGTDTGYAFVTGSDPFAIHKSTD